MLIIMKPNATPQQIENVVQKIRESGLAAHLSQGIETTLIGAIGETHEMSTDLFEVLDGVDMVKRITQPFKLASRQFHPENSIFPVDGFKVGGEDIVLIAGPCSVESKSQILET
ncbi:MAG: 3-deoxy-7-phosphoheptulonate synthase, partial [Anaerolineales bacterium]